MAEKRLANTSNGVEMVAVLDEAAHHAIAMWLCDIDDYHDKCDAFHGRKRSPKSDQAFESQRFDNGGYCNDCRDHAGNILENFQLVPKEQP